MTRKGLGKWFDLANQETFFSKAKATEIKDALRLALITK